MRGHLAEDALRLTPSALWPPHEREAPSPICCPSPLQSRTRVPRPMRPLTLSLSPGGEGIKTAPSPSERERVGVRVALVFTHNPA